MGKKLDEYIHDEIKRIAHKCYLFRELYELEGSEHGDWEMANTLFSKMENRGTCNIVKHLNQVWL